jgi:Dyp-type peroxidase family
VSDSNIGYLSKAKREITEKRYEDEKRKQPGVAFPSANKQEHLFIIRFDLAHYVSGDRGKMIVKRGLKKLCGLFDKINRGKMKLDEISEDGYITRRPLSYYNFSSTIGFGIGFFEKLNIIQANRPNSLKEMPSNVELGDLTPYSLLQTDFIIQLGAKADYVNRWVFQNSTAIHEKQENIRNLYQGRLGTEPLEHIKEPEPQDIFTALMPWAKIIDVHAGFQRIDGKNLLGFNDGISNPDRLSNTVVWTNLQDEKAKFKDSTYMVFQKIEHDLERWRNMHVEKQEQWVGRSKETGLLLGTLPKAQDRKLASDLHSEDAVIRESAFRKWKTLYKEQQYPDKKFFDSNQPRYRNIQLECPIWSHVRKANPRQADGAVKSIIFRRGYPYIDAGLSGKSTSGLLFVCFQRNIETSFENIKKNFLNNKDFPVPQQRANFNTEELRKRRDGRFTLDEIRKLSRSDLALPWYLYEGIKDGIGEDTENTGKDGLSGPSELGVYPLGQDPITTTLGGGYYFIPPIPNRNIADIGEQFFD